MKNNLKHVLLLIAIAVLALMIAACAPAAAPTSAPPTSAPVAATSAPAASGMDALVAAAKAEGALTVITLPRDWCNYGALMDGFQSKYGIKISDLIPDGGSKQEIEAITANKDNKGHQAPDVVDVGLAFGEPNKDLFQPYKVAGWNDIDNSVKEPSGLYYGDYFGVMAFLVNTDVVKNVPQDWADLLKPEYKNQVALTGDPRLSSQAYSSVFAAGLANGGSLDNAQAGLDFFAKLYKAGNLVPVISNNSLVAKGETPIRITWDYLALAAQDEAAVLERVQELGRHAFLPRPGERQPLDPVRVGVLRRGEAAVLEPELPQHVVDRLLGDLAVPGRMSKDQVLALITGVNLVLVVLGVLLKPAGFSWSWGSFLALASAIVAFVPALAVTLFGPEMTSTLATKLVTEPAVSLNTA